MHHHPPTRPLHYGSICSGIEAVSLACEPLRLQAAWFSEIESFPCAVLAHRYASVPNLGDMTAIASQIRAGHVVAPDILVGGTSYQAFSIADSRQGLDDPRGALTLSYVKLANTSTESASKTINRSPRLYGKTSPACSPTVPTPSDICCAHWPANATRSKRQGARGRTRVVCLPPAASRGR